MGVDSSDMMKVDNDSNNNNTTERKEFVQKLVGLKINKQRVIQIEQFLGVISDIIFFTKEFETVLVKVSKNPKLLQDENILKKLEFENMRAVQAISMGEINILSRYNKNDEECLKLGSNLVMDYVERLNKSNLTKEVKEQIEPLLSCIMRMFNGKGMKNIPSIKLRRGAFNQKNINKLFNNYVKSKMELNKKEEEILKNYKRYFDKQQNDLSNKNTNKNYEKIKNINNIKKATKKNLTRYYQNNLKNDNDSDSSDSSEDYDEMIKNYNENYKYNQHRPDLWNNNDSDFSSDDDTRYQNIQYGYHTRFQSKRDILNFITLGGKIDFQLEENKKYYKCIIKAIKSCKITLKLCNTKKDNINNNVIVIDLNHINPTCFAKYKFITKRPAHRLLNLRKNDKISIHKSYTKKLNNNQIYSKNLFEIKQITRFDKFSGQVQLENKFWIHRDDPRIQKISNTKKQNNNNNNNKMECFSGNDDIIDSLNQMNLNNTCCGGHKNNHSHGFTNNYENNDIYNNEYEHDNNHFNGSEQTNTGNDINEWEQNITWSNGNEQNSNEGEINPDSMSNNKNGSTPMIVDNED